MKQAAVALIEKDGLFLSVSRKNDPNIRGFAGGSVNDGETIEEAMVRELFEETGLRATSYEEFFKDNDGIFETTCFLVQEYEGEAYSKETGIVEWVKKEQLCVGPFAWYNTQVFAKYLHPSCQSHCCINCKWCKYNYNDCPVVLGEIMQDNSCENCDNDSGMINLSEHTFELLKEHIKATPHYGMDGIIYKALSKLPLEKEAKCNLCGLSCRLNDPHEGANCGLVNARVSGGFSSTPGNGRGALDDCSSYHFSLCEFCCDWLFKQFVVPVVTLDMSDGQYDFISAEDRVKNDDWRKMKEKFFEEYNKRNLARQIK